MELIIHVQPNVTAFSAIKTLMQAIDFTPKTRLEQLGAAVLFPDHPAIREVKRAASLTDAIEPVHQIRFALKDRVTRCFHKLAVGMVARWPGEDTVHIFGMEHLDDGSRRFLTILSRYLDPGKIVLECGSPATAAQCYLPTAEEERLNLLLLRQAELSAAEEQFLLSQAARYILCWDYWTALAILKFLDKRSTQPKIYQMLGLCLTFFERTVEAQWYYERAIDVGDLVEKVNASYTLAMLYARHHRDVELSLAKAEQYLQTAYSWLLEPATPSDQLTFLQVFNRNGYALLQFRRGKVREAIDYLDAGLHRLATDMREQVYLHKTVLLYNKAQCYQALQDHPMTVQCYLELLSLDPNFPEYYMEFAKYYLSCGAAQQALPLLQQARELDESIPELFSLLGFALAQLGRHQESIAAYRQAWELNPESAQCAYDYAFQFSTLDRYPECLHIIQGVTLAEVPTSLQEDVISLHAEALLNTTQSAEAALQQLDWGLQIVPHSAKLMENRVLIEQYRTHAA